jgi:mono/diheme cytochrome c family protein
VFSQLLERAVDTADPTGATGVHRPYPWVDSAVMRRIALLVTTLAIALAGCGGSEMESAEPETVEGTVPEETTANGGAEGDPAAGEEVFASAGCGSCHVYEPAGSSGTAGPNLDESDVDYEGAYEQIANGGGGMPAFEDQLSEQEIADVAAFVTEGS